MDGSSCDTNEDRECTDGDAEYPMLNDMVCVCMCVCDSLVVVELETNERNQTNPRTPSVFLFWIDCSWSVCVYDSLKSNSCCC